MSYGYDSAVAFSKSVAEIEDFAADLLSRVSDERQSVKVVGSWGIRPPADPSKEKSRPIVFICHSLGGIVFKKVGHIFGSSPALILAHQRSSTFSNVLESVTGVVFLGTPHRGSDAAYWTGFIARALKAAQLGTGTNDQLLAALQKNSKTLSDISEQFVERADTLRIRTFYETKKLDFLSSLVVEKDSACLHISNEKLPTPIQATHTTMCKFSDKDSQKYKPVWSAVRELVELSRSGRDIQAPSDNGGQSRTAAKKHTCIFLPSQNPRFFGRDGELKEIKARLGSICPSATPPSITLEGIGGVGKTSIALQFAHMAKTWCDAVLWIHSETTIALAQSYTDAARSLHLPGLTDGDHANNRLIVLEWFSNTDSRWLLVFDNVEDAEHLEQYRPKSGNGSILITTRKPNIGYELTNKALVVGPFSPEEGTKFVLELATWQNNAESDTQSAAELNKKLGGLPLGITQMVALMRAKAVSLQVFLIFFHDAEEKLIDLALIAKDAGTGSLSLHRLVQAEFEYYLSPHERQGAFGIASKLLYEAFPKGFFVQTYEDYWAAGQPYIEHVVALNERYLREESDLAQYRPMAEFAKLISHTGTYLAAFDDFDTSDMVVQGGMDACKQLADQDSQPSTSAHLNHVSGISKLLRGDFKGSEGCLLKALHICRQLNPSVDHDIAMKLNDLGLLYDSMCDHEQARVYLEESLAFLRKLEPSENRDMSISLVNLNLARNAVHKGDVDSAKLLLEAQLDFYKTRGNSWWMKEMKACAHYEMGNTCYSMGNLKDARSHFQEAHSSFVEVGKATKGTVAASCIYKLARISLQQGNSEDAE
ncbi:MAG: hypothetical protein Q9179_006109 [Wetmoreana sp. 5 TL-2023]